MGSKLIVGMEVPIIGSDSVKWIEVAVPVSDSSPDQSSRPVVAPLTKDAASCSALGDPPTYLMWRIHKSRPCALEVLEVCADREAPRVGVRLLFPEALSPFAFACKNEFDSTGNLYLLYAMSVYGVAYLFRLKNISAYAAYATLSPSGISCCNLQHSPDCTPITAAAAVAGCLVIGRDDGSVTSYQLGIVDPNSSEFMSELRDDAGLGRIWGFMSRSRMVRGVVDMVISSVHGRKVAFVLHSDGVIKVWDLFGRGRIFCHSLNIPDTSVARLWVGQSDYVTNGILLGVFSRQTSELNSEGIYLYHLKISLGDKINFSLDSSMHFISLSEGKLIDVKLASNKIWVLKEDGLLVQDLFDLSSTIEGQFYGLQESFVADQLFQNSGNCLDNLFHITGCIFSSAKPQMISFISNIFSHRILHPGVLNSRVLRSTFEDYGKRWSDADFQSLSVDGIRSEILSLIEHEAMSGSSVLIFKCWRDFCTRYFEWWCKINKPYCLFLDSSKGAYGLIRASSISVFRNLQKIEKLVYGNFDNLDDVLKYGLGISDNGLESEFFFEVLRCNNCIAQRLGRAVSPVFYESLVNFPMIRADDIVLILIKTLESGCSSSVASLQVSLLGTDVARQKVLADHRSVRRFSLNMLLSLQALYKRANGWGKVLDVIESYLKLLIPMRVAGNMDSTSDLSFNITASVVVQATVQVAKVIFESGLDILLFLNYLLKIGGQIHLLQEDIVRIQLELIPMVYENITEWLIIQFVGMSPSESIVTADFSSQLSSLCIDGSVSKASWTEKLGSYGFTLASALLMNSSSFEGHNSLISGFLPSPESSFSLVQNFCSWIIWGGSGEGFSHVFGHSSELATILLKHGQYNAVETVLKVMSAHLSKEKLAESIQNTDGEWCLLHHLLGCCLAAQTQCGLHGSLKEKKVSEAVRCFFRASSGEGASNALQKIPHEAGLPHLGFTGCVSTSSWRLHYYQWVMQIFEQYNISDAACQFALAALEEVDEATNLQSLNAAEDTVIDESATMIKGRLWANVFKFMLDLNEFYDAYCAIITNPDEESKYICLRRFIIVLYERGETKMLCNGQLPFVRLTEKVEQELAWKAVRSDISAKLNPYKLLYSFEMHQQNWRKAASYIYIYSVKLKSEMALRSYHDVANAIQERVYAISAALNALHLVHPMYAWIDLHIDRTLHESHLSKKARISDKQLAAVNVQSQKSHSFIGIESLEEEFVLTSAEQLLSLANIRWTYTGNQKQLSEVVDLLIEVDMYDMAFSVLLRFWKGSELQREIEKVFSTLSLRCSAGKSTTSCVGSKPLLLMASADEDVINGGLDLSPKMVQSKGVIKWEMLEHYLEKYRTYHPRLPVVVADTLLRSDPQIDLPLWLVNMFKVRRRKSGWGMTGQESDPASLLRLYVDYGRYKEATDLLTEYLEAYASVRVEDLIHRKRPFASWFPYTAMEQLWCRLEESIRSGHMTEQCSKLKSLIHGALLTHLHLLKEDSEAAVPPLSQAR